MACLLLRIHLQSLVARFKFDFLRGLLVFVQHCNLELWLFRESLLLEQRLNKKKQHFWKSAFAVLRALLFAARIATRNSLRLD